MRALLAERERERSRECVAGSVRVAADDEWHRLIQQRNELESGRNQTVEELAELEQRLHNAQQEPGFESEPVDRQESTAAAETAVKKMIRADSDGSGNDFVKQSEALAR